MAYEQDEGGNYWGLTVPKETCFLITGGKDMAAMASARHDLSVNAKDLDE